MPRPLQGRVGGSAGAAEHRQVKHRIARALSRTTTLTRAIALGCVAALALAGVPAVAPAKESPSPLRGLRAGTAAPPNQGSAPQPRSAALDRHIELLSKTLADEQHRVDRIRVIADKRAVQIYEDSTQGLGTMFGGQD